VADITHDGSPDFISRVPFRNMHVDLNNANTKAVFPSISYRTGLVKAGPGTMELASVDNAYTYGTRVDEGTLLVGGALTTSAVTVNEGGYLGGTGTVTTVTLAVGGGLTAASDQTKPLEIGTLTANGTVKVNLVNPAKVAVAELRRVPVARWTTLSGTLTQSSLSVTLDGAESTDVRVLLKDNMIYVTNTQGTIISLY